MPFCTAADGSRLSYELEGSGPPLLLHLGAGCDSELWRAAGYVTPLARAHTCILFDHRGHGRSDHPVGPAAYDISAYVSDVLTLFDHLEIERAAFWGYSYGAAVGVTAAARSQRIRCLVMSGAIWNDSAADISEFAPARIAELREHGWDKIIADFEADEGETPDWMKRRIRATNIEPYIAWWQARLARHWNAWDLLSEVAVPGLLVVGELEDPDDEMAEAAVRMRYGRRIRVPGRGHITAFLDRDRVLPHVASFLAAQYS